MKLPHLTQRVALERGQSQLLGWAVHNTLELMLKRDPQAGHRLSSTEALSLAPLTGLLKRLDKLTAKDAQPLRDGKKAKPHRLRLDYLEIVSVRLHYERMLRTAEPYPEHAPQLATALGVLHQASLNLDGHILLVQ
jgi:hypothetical protein